MSVDRASQSRDQSARSSRDRDRSDRSDSKRDDRGEAKGRSRSKDSKRRSRSRYFFHSFFNGQYFCFAYATSVTILSGRKGITLLFSVLNLGGLGGRCG